MNPLFITTLAAALALTACAPQGNPGPTPFLTSAGADTSARISRLPFKNSWRNPDIAVDHYTHIVVRPVTTRYLDSAAWQKSKSTLIPDQATYQAEAARLAKHWNSSLRQAFSDPLCVFYITGDTSRPNTLVLEVAITAASFGRPTDANTLATAPAVAFEARFLDASSGTILGSASDLRSLPFNAGEFDKKSLPAANQRICDAWSRQLMEATNKEIFPTVRRGD